MGRPRPGHLVGMNDEHPDREHELPTTNKPLHGERRPLVTPALAVIGLVLLVAVIVAVLTWTRYNT